MTKASNARAAKRSAPARRARMSIAEGSNQEPEQWTKASSLAYIGRLGTEKGAGDVSLASLAVHLVKMGDLAVYSSKGDDTKHALKEYWEKRNGRAQNIEKPGDATKFGQYKNFIKLGELVNINGEGLLARALVTMQKHRVKGSPVRAKSTFAGYLEAAKAQVKKPDVKGGELTADELANAVLGKEGVDATLESEARAALEKLTAAAAFKGAPKALTDLATTLQGVIAKLPKVKATGAK